MESPIPLIDVAKAAFNMLVQRADETARPNNSSQSILALDNHIHAIEAMMTFLVNEANAHLSTLKQSRNTLVPIHILPDELLVDIWLLCVEDASQFDDQLHTLALVCKSWHRGVLDHSVLWCHLQDTCKSEWYNNRVLQRSQNYPLHLRLLAQNPNISETLIDMAMPECHRWKSFVLAPNYRAGSRIVEPRLNLLAEANLENLITFEVHARTNWNYPDPILLPTTPSLREVRLERFPLRWETLNAPQLRALRITSLLFGGLSFSELLDLIRSTPLLEILLLKGMDLEGTSDQESPVLLPRLRTLYLSGVPCDDLLRLIRTENIQQLLGRPASFHLWKPPQCPILNNIKATGVVKLVYRDSVHIATDPHPFYPIEWPYHNEVLTTEGFAFTTTNAVRMRDFLHITEWVGSLGAHAIVDLQIGNPPRSSVDLGEIP
ncbi:hypothetical protein FRC01_012698, partial [Tulasnella sp. 417]